MKRFLKILLILIVIVVAVILITNKAYSPQDWSSFNVLEAKAPRPIPPSFKGKRLPDDEYLKWVQYGEDWFRNATFGNERVWTDVVGLLNGPLDIPDGKGGFTEEPFFKYFLRAIDALDGVSGNLYSGNGGGYTSDLIVTLPPGTMLDRTFPLPEKLHTGLDVEAGSAWPLGIVPMRAPKEEENLPYLLDPSIYATGPGGVGPGPGGKYRVGLTCALCHISLDLDWDGKPDLKSARHDQPTPGSPYRPDQAIAIGNQDIALGYIFAMSVNTIAGFSETGPAGSEVIQHTPHVGTTPDDAVTWGNFIKANYQSHPDIAKREVDRGLLLFPRGFADDTPDGLHNPLQFPSLFTNWDWPFNYDGVMLNASDRNNNVWTNGLDPTQLEALCNDRAGKYSKILGSKGVYSPLSAADYADIEVYNSPAVRADPSQREKLKNVILGYATGLPGMLRSDAEVLLTKRVPGTVPDDIADRAANKQNNRVRSPADFGQDGARRGMMIGLLGTRVATPPELSAQYHVPDLEREYGINGDEFVTDAISLMLDWVEPPPNLSPLLANAKRQGLVQKGYQVFKEEGCADCHAGPFFTNNLIIPLKEIGTDSARADATAPLQYLAPEYDPRTGLAVSGGILGALRSLISGRKPGYKVVTLRYVWGSAPYLHDGGVGVALRPDAAPPGDDLQALLSRPAGDKIYGIAQILLERDARPETYLRANAALSLQGLLLQSERQTVIDSNNAPVYPIPGSSDKIPISAIHIQGVGHRYFINDRAGGDRITALVAFLLALDDDPSRK